ncbi:hypothetical protein JXQ31_00210 [candidate division KSB1 bacterium]|nr:hypothetical protein [candidate division KSB1 bacterium]
MKKSIIFVLVGLVYIVLAMAVSTASTSTALDKTLEFIGITPGTNNTSTQHSGDINLNSDDSNSVTPEIESYPQLEQEQVKKYEDFHNEQLANVIPIPPPPSDPPGPVPTT